MPTTDPRDERSPASNRAEVRGYLAGIKRILATEWPANRCVNIVCHGHSVPAGYFKTPFVDTFNAYPHLLHVEVKKRFPSAVMNVIVSAIGGEHSEQGAMRFDAEVLSHRPDLVTIDYSLNDRCIGLERASAAWSSMIERALAAGCKVMLLTPTGDLSARIGDSTEPLEKHAAQVRALAAAYGVALADSYGAFAAYVNSGKPMDDLMSQINHPNRAGHELVVAEILKWLL